MGIDSTPPLDYYLIRPAASPAGDPAAMVVTAAIVVEEFVRDPDFSALGLDSACWTPAGGWGSSAGVSRGMRTDAALRDRVVPVGRAEAEAAYQRLGGHPLPVEPLLRNHFSDRHWFATAPPLRLGPAEVPDGWYERRLYRVLFAGNLDGAPVPDGQRRTGDGDFSWAVRRIGREIAWCLDVTVLLATADDRGVGPVLAGLTDVVRRHGLIPVTTERFA